jgi:hypothetical protein
MKIFKLIGFQNRIRTPSLNGILCIGYLGMSIHLLAAEDSTSLSPYHKDPYKKYSNNDFIELATKNPKLLEIPIDGELPIHHALNLHNWELAKVYAQLAPNTLLQKFKTRHYYPLDFLLDSRNYELASEFIKINPETTRLFTKETFSPLRYLYADRKDIPKLKKYPEFGILLFQATRPQASKYNPDVGGAIKTFSFVLDQIRYLRETPNFDFRLRLMNSYYYATNLEILTEAFPHSIDAKDWNPKFQLVFLEIYLHIANAFEDLNSIFCNGEKYTLDFYRAYNSFLSQLFNNIALTHKETPSYETPNILHLIHNQLRLSAEYTAEHLGDESTLRWSYVHTILFDLLNKMSKSEAFKAASKEFEKKFAENPVEFNKTVESLSRDYIKNLANYKIDYRSLEK